MLWPRFQGYSKLLETFSSDLSGGISIKHLKQAWQRDTLQTPWQMGWWGHLKPGCGLGEDTKKFLDTVELLWDGSWQNTHSPGVTLRGCHVSRAGTHPRSFFKYCNRIGLECPPKGTLFPLRKTLLQLQQQSGAPAFCRNEWVPNTIKGIWNCKSMLSPYAETWNVCQAAVPISGTLFNLRGWQSRSLSVLNYLLFLSPT